MYITNLKTGITQECSNNDVVKICKKDTEHFAVSETEPTVAPVQPEETDISKMKVTELKALAEEKGIEGAASMKKEDLIAALKGGEQDGESGEA